MVYGGYLYFIFIEVLYLHHKVLYDLHAVP
jgi:hypothetical protein